MLQEFMKSISIVFYEALCCKIFLDIFLDKRKVSKLVSALSVCGLSAIIMFWALSTYFQKQYVFRTIGMIFSIFLFSVIFYQGRWTKKIFMSTIFYAILVCVDYLGIIFVDLAFSDKVLSNDIIQVIIVLLCKTILFLFVLFLSVFWKEEKNIEMKNSEWILLICFPILTVMIILVMLFSVQEKNNSIMYLVVSFGMMIMNVVVFCLLKYVSEREQRFYQMQLMHERNKERMQAYQEINNDYENQKSILHDYNNQIRCIRGLIQEQRYDSAQEYAGKLVNMLEEGREVVNVNNPVINVILNQKYRLAKSKDIAILFQVNNLAELWLSDQDMVILLSNLLDNAIEACEKLNQERIIRVKLLKRKKQLILSIQNPVNGTVNIKNNTIVTEKKDKKRHGIGLKNVQMVIEKYAGIGMMRCEDGWFYYTASIPENEQ